MRLYSFGNMYLIGVHAGIQCQHCSVEIMMKYQSLNGSARGILFDWAENHKTTILLNGGMQEQLSELFDLFQSKDNPYPWDFFVESHEALNNCMTNVSIVLPEKIYMYSKWLKQEDTAVYDDGRDVYIYPQDDPTGAPAHYEYTPWELKLIEILNSKRLMS
ncbi:hypothetical protein N9937_00945 [bacterium]|nr:hypothetical protein [bacterium]